jgi:hypothetical protein
MYPEVTAPIQDGASGLERVVTRVVIVRVRIAEPGTCAPVRALRALVVQLPSHHLQQSSAAMAGREYGEIRTVCTVWMSDRSR